MDKKNYKNFRKQYKIIKKQYNKKKFNFKNWKKI